MEELMRDALIVASHSPKRGREEELAPHIVKKESNAQVKRLRKAKTHAPLEKDRTRGRYACLGHRMKHKRCPLDCPERRPKPNQEQEEASVLVKKEIVTKPRVPRGNSTIAKKHVLQLEECTIRNPGISRDTPQSSLVSHTTHPTERDANNWDSVEWEGLGWDNEHCLKEPDAWMDLKSSSHWEESKSRPDAMMMAEDSKPTDDLTKFEEDEIIDSWLNDDGFGSSAQEFDSTDGNASEETGEERRTTVQYNLTHEVLQILPKILLTREMLERWLHEPYFNRLMQGCFVRVKIGEYKESPVYRIAHIEEVQDGCFFSYTLTKEQTTKGLALQIGASSRKIFPIAAISNSPPTESDKRSWQEEMEKSNICLDPTEVQQKQEIVRVLHIKYPLTFAGAPQDVEPMVNEPIWNC